MPTFYEDPNMFQLRSGNKSPLEFKQMGSSALHHTKIDGADHTKDGKGKHPGTYRAHNMERPEGYDQFGNPIEEPAATKKIGDKMREIKVEQEDKEDVTTDTNDLKNDNDDDKPGLEDAGTGAISLL